MARDMRLQLRTEQKGIRKNGPYTFKERMVFVGSLAESCARDEVDTDICCRQMLAVALAYGGPKTRALIEGVQDKETSHEPAMGGVA